MAISEENKLGSQGDWTRRRLETGIWSQDDPEYDEAYFRQNTDSQWELPSTPFSMSVDMTLADPETVQAIAAELDQSNDVLPLDQLSLYAERLDGELQFILINDMRFETIEELPDNVRGFLDDLIFGDSLSPVVNAMGSRINLWDVMRGEPETQQALSDAGLYDEQGDIKLNGIFDSSTSLDALDIKSDSLDNGMQTRVVDMKVKQLLDTEDQQAHEKNIRRRSYFYKALAIVILSVIGLVVYIFTQ